MSLTVSPNQHSLLKKWQRNPSCPANHANLFFNCRAGIELSCVIESISTSSPRIEWKKITNDGPSYVYFNNKISGNI